MERHAKQTRAAHQTLFSAGRQAFGFVCVALYRTIEITGQFSEGVRRSSRGNPLYFGVDNT
jgi:hypothetical protein